MSEHVAKEIAQHDFMHAPRKYISKLLVFNSSHNVWGVSDLIR